MIKLAHFLACDWSVITSKVLSFANSSNLQIPLFRMIYTDTAPCLLLSFGLQILYKTWNIQSQTFFLMIWILETQPLLLDSFCVFGKLPNASMSWSILCKVYQIPRQKVYKIFFTDGMKPLNHSENKK